MIHAEFGSFLLGKFLEGIPATLKNAFSQLKPDPIEYRETNFQSRHRSFSSYRISDDEVANDPDLATLFNGARTFHKVYGEAVPEPDAEVVGSAAIEAFLANLIPAMPLRDPSRFAIGVNLVRVIANEVNMGSPAPGLHQDGYDFSCHVNISRRNVSGGCSILACSAEPADIVFEHTLQPNEFVFFNDVKLFHTATPITQRIVGEPTWRDMIIVDLVALPEFRI